MAINTVASGETFEVWLQATNDTITEINNADSSGGANRLVRYDSAGGLALSNFNTDALTLKSGVTVNAISSTVSSSATDLELATSRAIYDYVEGGKHNLYDPTDGQTKMVVDYMNGAKIFVSGVEVFGATADSVHITANTTFDKNVHVIGNLTVEGENVSIATTQLTVEDQVVTFNKGNINGDANNSGFEIEGPGNTIVSSFLYDNGGYNLTADSKSVRFVPALASLTVNFDQDVSTVSNVHFNAVNIADTFIVPKETATPAVADSLIGQIHFNTTDQTFEGFDGSVWGSLGGVSTPDKSTRIVADRTFRNLQFRANNVDVATFTDRNLGFTGEVSVSGNTAISGELTVSGETFIHDNLLVDGDVSANGSLVALGSNSITLKDYAVTLTQDVTGIANTLSADDQTVPTTNTVFAAINDVAGQVSSLDLAIIQDGGGANTFVRTSGNTVHFVSEGTQVARFTNVDSTFDNDVVLKGNLTVLGTQTILDVTDMSVKDKNIILNKGGDTGSAFDSGISVDGTNAHFQMQDANTWHIAGHDGEGKLEADGALTLRVDGADSVHMDTAYASFAGLSEGIVLPTANGATSPAQGTIRFNDSDQQFQGYFGGTWQGLGGVITPDKKTSIVAEPTTHQLQFKANNVNSLVITEDIFRLWGAPIKEVDNASLSANATAIPTSSVVSTKIAQLQSDLQTNIDTKADSSEIVSLQTLKANTPSITNQILGWDGSDWMAMTLPETIGLPDESSSDMGATAVVKFDKDSNSFFNTTISISGYSPGDVVTPPTASGTEQVLQWDGNNIVNVGGFASTNFVRKQFFDASGNPLPATAANEVLAWSGGASGKLQHKTLNFVDATTLASRFPQADTPDGYVLRWDSANNKIVSADGFTTETQVRAFFPTDKAENNQITVWNGGAFENISLATTSVSSIDFDTSLTPATSSLTTQALQWDGEEGKFVHGNFANTDYVDQEVSTRATQAFVIAQVDNKANQSDVDALQTSKADDAEIKEALTNKLDKLGPATGTGNYLYWDGDSFAEGSLPPAIGLPGEQTKSNQMLRWNASGTFENVNISTVTVSETSANNVVPEGATGTTGVVQWDGDKFINVPGFATESFITSKFPLKTTDSSNNEILTWTADGFRNKATTYVKASELTAKFPAGTPGANDVLQWDAANSKIVPVSGYAKSTDISDRFPDSANTTQANQVLKWDGNKLIHVEKVAIAVTETEAANILPDETSGDYDILQFRDNKLKNVSGIFAQREEFLGLRDTATTKSYVDTELSKKADDDQIRTLVSDKASQKYVDDELELKAPRPAFDENTPSDHYLRWTASGFVAEEFTNPINLPTEETGDGYILRWTGGAFENAEVSTVEVSEESANNVVPGTKTSNTGAVQWTGTKFVNKDGFATEEFVTKQLPKDAARSNSLTEVLTWSGTNYAKVDLANSANPMATKAFVNDKIAVSGDTSASDVLVWKNGKLDSAPAQFAMKTEVNALTVSLEASTADNQVLKWINGEFQHANVAEKIITTEGFDTALTPNDYSSRSQALQWKDGVFKHASFVTPNELTDAIANTVNADFVNSKFTAYTNTDDMNNQLALKVDTSTYSTEMAGKADKPENVTPDNYYLRWTGNKFVEQEIVTTIGTPNLDTEEGQIITWNAAEQRFEHATLSFSGFEAPSDFVTPAYETQSSQILAWKDGKFENRNGFATEDYVKGKLPKTDGTAVTQINQALIWSGNEFQNRDLDETFATIDYVDGIMPEQSTANNQVLHWDNDAGKLKEYTGFATQASIDKMLPNTTPGTNQVLSWNGKKFEYVTISTVTIDKENFDVDTFMPGTESNSTQALQWNGEAFVHGTFANTAYVDDAVQGFVDADYVSTAVTNRAQKSYVDNQLREKANTDFVTTSLQAKMDVPTLSDSTAGHYLVMDGGKLSEKEFTIPFTTPENSGDREVLQWFNGGFINAQITTTVMNEADAGNILPGTGTGDDGEKVVIWNAAANTFQNIPSPYAKKAELENIKPLTQSISANNEVLKWSSDGSLRNIDIVQQFGLAKTIQIDSIKPSKGTGEGEVLTWDESEGKFKHVEANTSYIDNMMPTASDVTTDGKRLKWDGQRFVNVNVTQRVINEENFDKTKFMPAEASSPTQALQWDGNNFVHGTFANTSYIDKQLATKVGVNYVNTAVSGLARSIDLQKLEANTATVLYVDTEVGNKAPKPASTTESGYYLTWNNGWQEVKAAETITPPAGDTGENQIVVYREGAFENISFTTVNVTEESATNILPSGETGTGGALRWDAANSKLEHVYGFVNQDYIDVRMPDKPSDNANNEVLVWSSGNKFVNKSLDFLTEAQIRAMFPQQQTVSGEVLKWNNSAKAFETSDEFVQKTTFDTIFPDESSDPNNGFVIWSDSDKQFINKEFAPNNITADSFDADVLMPKSYSATNEALQWVKNEDTNKGVFKHAQFANSSYVANKLTETESRVIDQVSGTYATLSSVGTIETSIQNIQDNYAKTIQLNDFATKPAEVMNSGEYLYWTAQGFAKGTLPSSVNKPQTETQAGQVLVWKNNAFENVTLSLTPIAPDDVEDIRPQSLSQSYSDGMLADAIQWVAGAEEGDSNRFANKTFATAAYVDSKLPKDEARAINGGYDALQWNGTDYVNSTLSFLKQEDLTEVLPDSTGADGVVQFAGGKFTKSMDFAKKSYVDSKLPLEKNGLTSTQANQVLVWNGQRLENIALNTFEFEKAELETFTFPSCNENQALQWTGSEFAAQAFASQNYVSTEIGNLDFTKIRNTAGIQVQAFADQSNFVVSSTNGPMLDLSHATADFGDTTVKTASFTLSGATVDGIVTSVTNDNTKIPTSGAVESAIQAKLNSFSEGLSTDSIVNSNTMVRAASTNIVMTAENADVVIVDKTQVEISKNTVFTNGSTVTIDGDLFVNGSTTTISTADLEVQDSNILLNKGGNDANGSGISVEANGSVVASINLNTSQESWELNTTGDGHANISAASGKNFGVIVENNKQLEIDSTTTTVHNTLSAQGPLNVTGLSTLNGGVDVNGASTLDGALTVTQLSTLSGGASVTGSLSATGALSTDNNLTVEGTSTLKGAVTAQDNLSVAGDTTLSSSLSVLNSSATTLSGTLQVDGTSTLTGAVTAQDTLTVGGTSTLTGDVTLGAGAGLQIGSSQQVTEISNDKDAIVGGGTATLMTASAIAGKLADLSGALDSVSDSLAGTTSVSNSDGNASISAVSGGGVTFDSGTASSSIIGEIGGDSKFDVDTTRFNISNALNVVGATTMTDLTATTIAETSTAALKTNVTAIDGALSKVMALRGVEFNWINNINGSKEYGLIAEDVAQVAPNLVSYEQEEAKGVKYSKMVSLLIEAMKEQQKEIDELKKKLN